MMVTVTIGNESRSDSDISESWITQQINRRRRDGVPACVIVKINEAGLNMTLRTVDCGPGGGGGRPPNSHEQWVFDLWAKLHLNESGFTGGNLLAFLNQL